jgi:endoglucanase
MKIQSKLISLFAAVLMLVSILSSSVAASYAEQSLLGRDYVKKPSEAGALQVKDVDGQMKLCDKNGEPVQLRGMSTHGLQWFGEIINDNAFSALSTDWECNVIRLAMYIGETGYATDPTLKDLVYQGIDLALANDMYVIVDWHVLAPGDPNDPIYAGAYDFFDEISSAYKDNAKNFQIIYEICNEPSPNSTGGQCLTNDAAGWEKIKSYSEPIISMLREKGDNIILVGSPNWSQRPDLAADDPIDATNLLYTVHFYSGSHFSSENSSDRGNVMSNARYALDNGVGIFVSEWGSSEASGNNGPFLDEADIWLDFLNQNEISWVNWSLTNKNETSGSFIPYIMGVSEATLLDPGADKVWAPEEMSISGEYARARIKGIEYSPIDRLPEGAFSEVIWTFDDGTTQGFGLNRDSGVKNVELSGNGQALLLTNMKNSKDITDTNYWANVRISSEGYNPSVDIFGADIITMDILVAEPTTVSIACVPQSDTHGWANPSVAVFAKTEDFKEQPDGTYLATVKMTSKEAPNLEVIATDKEGSVLSNMVIFVGSEKGKDVMIDNITISGAGASALPPLEHADKGTAKLPADFEDGTRQGFDWSVDSGTKTSLTIEPVNGSKALSFEFSYPDVKPTDNWASAPRLDLWLDPLARGENDYVTFDLYIEPTRATTGTIAISGAFQPPEQSYWAQIPDSYNVELSALEKADQTPEGQYHYFVTLKMRDIENIKDDTFLRNMILIFADIESDFQGRMYVDNVKFMTQADVDALAGPPASEDTKESSVGTVVESTSADTTTESTVASDSSSLVPVIPSFVVWIVLGLVVFPGIIVLVLVLTKKKGQTK